MTNLDATFSALADPTRRAVVELLTRESMSAGQLAKAVKMSPPALSRHLKTLRKHGLVEEQRDHDDARVRRYHLRQQRFRELREWVLEVETFWTDQLASFKRHAERKRRRL